jgi:O-methyltransferase
MLKTAVSKLQYLPSRIRRLRDEQWRSNIHLQFKDFTMIVSGIFAANLAIAEEARSVPGCVVECGVWRGGMTAGLVAVLGKDRKYYLLDSFEGLPPAQPIDGPAAIAWQQNTSAPEYFDNCSAGPEFAQTAMMKAGAKRFELVRGFFNDTLPTFDPEPIALLRLDGDWYDSTIECLNHLFDRVVPGGIIILDDYYTWDGCARALHDFLSSNKAVERIQSRGGVCFLKKA